MSGRVTGVNGVHRSMARGYEAFSSRRPSSRASIQAVVSDSKSVLSVSVKPTGLLPETRAATLS